MVLTALTLAWAARGLQGEHASQAADVFSFAVVMWELLTCV